MIRRATSRRTYAVLAGIGSLVFLSTLLNWPPLIRLPLVIGWLLVVPGWTWARRLNLSDRGDELALGIALSAAFLALVGATMVLTSTWSPLLALVLLSVVGALGAVVPVRTRNLPGIAGHGHDEPRKDTP